MAGFLAGAGAGAALTIVVRALDQATPILKGINTKMLAIGGAMTAVGIAGVVGLVKLTNSASDLQESINAVDVVFGEASDAIKEMSKTAATEFGLSQTAFNAAAVQFSSFAGVISEDGQTVDDVIKTITGRTADFASVMNIDLARAQTLIQAGLAGETEGLRRFGIDVSAASITAYALANGIGTVGEELTEQEKIQARYGSILEQTNKFAGDFVNTSDNLANSQRILKADTENLKAEFAQALLPVMETVVGVLRSIVGFFSDMSPTMKAVVIGLGALVAVLLILAGVIAIVTAVSSVLAVVWSPITLIILAIIAAIGLLIFIGVKLVKHWDVIVGAVKNLGASIGNVFRGIANIVIKVWNFVVEVIENSINRVIKMVNNVISAMNKIPGIQFPLIPKIDLGKFKATEFDLSEKPISETRGTTNNINIENVNGISGRDIAYSLQDELDNKVSRVSFFG